MSDRARPRVEPQPLGGVPEADRVKLHEIGGHSLLCYVMTGRAGNVFLLKGENYTEPYISRELGPLDETATGLFAACLDHAGIDAERCFFGDYARDGVLGEGSDLERFEKDLRFLHRQGWSHLNRNGISLVNCHLIRKFARGIHTAMHVAAYTPYAVSTRLTDAFYRSSPELAAFYEEPILKGDWQPKWDALAVEATRSYLSNPGFLPPLRSEADVIAACKAHLTRDRTYVGR